MGMPVSMEVLKAPTLWRQIFILFILGVFRTPKAR
jgi:hypothetical protein